MEEAESEVLLLVNMHMDPLDLLHERCGHVIQALWRNSSIYMLVTGTGLSWRLLTKKATRFYRHHLCKSYEKAKITHMSVSPSGLDTHPRPISF